MADAPKARRKAERRGHRAEWLAVLYLRLKGYRVVATRYKTHAGEIDVIARRGDLAVFIEVKARRTLGEAGESLSLRQRRRISRAASAFLQKAPSLQGLDQRYDIMMVAPWQAPHHIIDAWREWNSAAQ